MVDVADVALGSEGRMKLKLEGGKVIFSAEHNHASGSAKVEIIEDAKYFLELLKEAIPGKFDDIVIDVVEGVLP